MKKTAYQILCLALLALSKGGCSNTGQGTQPYPTAMPIDSSFASFLDRFDESANYSAWPATLMGFIEQNELYYKGLEDRTKILKGEFQGLEKPFLPFIPESEMVAADPFDSTDPNKGFELWAAKKWKGPQYWLVSILGFKEHRNEIVAFSAYHPLVLATYSGEGDLLDSFVWTYYLDDVETSSWYDIDVLQDTLVAGYKENSTNPNFSKIISKTIITPEGKFKTVYKAE